jgi:flagellar motor protein MotB
LVENFNIPAENLSTAGFGKRVPKNKAGPYAPENRRVQIANMASQKKANP